MIEKGRYPETELRKISILEVERGETEERHPFG